MVTIYDHRGNLYERDTDAREVARIFKKQGTYQYGTNLSRTSWLYAVVSDIATSLSQVPFSLYAPKSGIEKRYFKSLWVEVPNHPLKVLLENPNQHQSIQRFIMQWATYMLMTGNAFIYLRGKNSFNIPSSMEVYGQFSVAPVRRASNDPPEAWEITFNSTENRVRVPLEDVVHCMMPNDYDQYIGIPPWLAVALQMDADNARVIYDKYFFRNNATPDSVLTYKHGPLNESTKRSIMEEWNDIYGGPESAGSIAVLGGDFDLKVLGVPHSAAQYIDSRKFTREEIASVYHYPVQMLNQTDGSNLGRDMLSVARKIKYENAVIPLGTMLESEFTRKVVRMVVPSRKKVSAFFDYDGLPISTDDMLDKAQTLKVLVEAGVPVNAGIAKIDLGIEPIDGGDSPRKENSPKNTPRSPQDAEDNNDSNKSNGRISKGSFIDQLRIKEIESKAKEKLDSVSDVTDYVSRKIKRSLYDLRSQYYKNLDNTNFDKSKHYETWRFNLFKPLYYAYLVSKGKLSGDEISFEFRSGEFCKNIPSSIDAQILQSTSIIDQLHEEITKWINDGVDIENAIKTSFEDINHVAHSLAVQQVIWAMNQGVLDSGKAFMIFRLREECQIDHDTSAAGSIGQCWCILV